MSKINDICIKMPGWLDAWFAEDSKTYPSMDVRMQVVLELAQQNIREKTGGPFGAAIFNMTDFSLCGVGVNLVISSNYCGAHAEMLAFASAQQNLGTYDLSTLGDYELVSSTEPCVMCLGATIWSGVKRVICSARDDDARAIGFDEGPKPSSWIEELNNRGIEVVMDVHRNKGIAILQSYASEGGLIYNAGRKDA